MPVLPQAPILPPAPIAPPKPITPPTPPKPVILPPPPTPRTPAPMPPLARKTPILVIPQKMMYPKEISGIPSAKLRPMPVWIKLGIIAVAVVALSLALLYGYWKFYIQKNTPAATPPMATTTPPTLPIAPTATSTVPIKFFNKLPNKSVIIDLPQKTSAALLQALKAEAKVAETRASVKQIKITYKGTSLTTEEFFNLFSIFTPKDFLSNYENEFILALFGQKEGARPILILKAKNGELAKTQMANWEKAAMASDVLPLFLSDFKLPKYLPAFKSYLFVSQPVRYLNINMPFASLNYAVYNSYVIFTASSAGMFVVLQDLTGQIVSQNYLDNLKASIETFVK